MPESPSSGPNTASNALAATRPPARGSGGHHVLFVGRRDPHGFEAAFDRVRSRGTHVIVQTYLPEFRSAGDADRKSEVLVGDLLVEATNVNLKAFDLLEDLFVVLETIAGFVGQLVNFLL